MSDQPAKKPGSQPFALAYWFVTEYMHRPWTGTDDKGRHLKHAQVLLKDYSLAQIKGCLLAMRAGRVAIGKYQVMYLSNIREGEPPYIEQYKALALRPPPQWMKTSYQEWCQEFDPHAASPAPTAEQEPLCPRFPPPTSLSSARLHTRRLIRS